jgi:hypothetical protein
VPPIVADYINLLEHAFALFPRNVLFAELRQSYEAMRSAKEQGTSDREEHFAKILAELLNAMTRELAYMRNVFREFLEPGKKRKKDEEDDDSASAVQLSELDRIALREAIDVMWQLLNFPRQSLRSAATILLSVFEAIRGAVAFQNPEMAASCFSQFAEAVRTASHYWFRLAT